MIGVVGAGITGLTLAYELSKRGRSVRLWEACDRPGGVMWSEEVDGRVVDLGPQRTRMTAEVRRLVEEMGLDDQVLTAPPDLPLFVYRDGKLRRVPFSAVEAVRTDLISWRGKLRALLEPLAVPRRRGETVEEFFVRSFGREMYENLLGPMYGGLYASDPARMPARHALAKVLDEFGVGPSLLWAFLRRGGSAREAVPTITFQGGLGALSRALADALGDDLRLGTPVDRMVQGPGGRVRVETGDGATEVRALVLTCPAGAAAEILRDVAPVASDRLASLTYNRLGVVHLRSDCDVRGYGCQVAFGEELETRGTTWNASIFDRDGVYTAYLGGMKNPELADEPDDRIGRIAAREFEVITGCPAEVLKVSRTRMPAWDRTWDALGEVRVPGRVHLCANYTARPGIPGRLKEARELAARLA